MSIKKKIKAVVKKAAPKKSKPAAPKTETDEEKERAETHARHRRQGTR